MQKGARSVVSWRIVWHRAERRRLVRKLVSKIDGQVVRGRELVNLVSRAAV